MDYMIPENDYSDEDKAFEDSSSTIVGSTPDMKGDNRFSSTSSFGQKFNDTEYVIAELAKHDDVALLAPWKRKLHRMAPLFTLVALGGYYVYYAFRIYYTVEAQRAYGKTFPMAWVFIGAEFLVTGKSIRGLHEFFSDQILQFQHSSTRSTPSLVSEAVSDLNSDLRVRLPLPLTLSSPAARRT